MLRLIEQFDELRIGFQRNRYRGRLVDSFDRFGDLLCEVGEGEDGGMLPATILDAIAWYAVEVTDVTEEQIEMALRKQGDGADVLVTVSPGVGFEFRLADTNLILNDGNRDYLFAEQ